LYYYTIIKGCIDMNADCAETVAEVERSKVNKLESD
jgi:hypothetical protein